MRRKKENRGKAKQGDIDFIEAVEILEVGDYNPRRIPSKAWRECIKKVWEVDPLECPRCGAEMKIVSFITEAAVIRRILQHLNLWRESMTAAKPPPALVISNDIAGYEPFDDGWAGYEEPSITLQ